MNRVFTLFSYAIFLLILAPNLSMAQGGDCGTSGWIGIGPTTMSNCGCSSGCSPTYCSPVATGNCSRQTISITLTVPPCYNGTVAVKTIECAVASGLDAGDYAQVGSVREDGSGNKVIDISDCVSGDPGASKTIDVTLSANRKDEVISYEMTCVEHNTTGCSGATPPCGAVMPVELIHFSIYTGDHARLEWSTASEVNNEFFSLQRADGDMQWKDLYTIEGQGDRNTPTDYYYIDEHPLEGNNYYRLLQQDYDGSQSFSHIVHWERNATNTSELRGIYPNPTSDQIIIDLNTPGWISGTTSITLTNLNGQKVFFQKIETNDGRFDYPIDVSQLPAGMYNIGIQCQDRLHHSVIMKK